MSNPKHHNSADWPAESADNIEEPECPLCGGHSAVDFKQGAHHLNLVPPIGCVRCQTCRLIFLSPRPSAEVRRMLMNGVVPDSLRPYGGSPPRYTAVSETRLEFFRSRACELRTLTRHDMLDNEVLLLDVGASSGALLQAVSRFGWRAVGIEPSTAGAIRCRSRGFECPRAVIEELPFRDETFNIVHAHHVFEHFGDPMKAAREVYRVLRPGGRAFVEVPNQMGNVMFIRDSLFGRVPQRKRNHRSIHHLWFFSRTTLGTLFESAGFSSVVVQDSYSWPSRGWRFPFSVLTRLIGKKIGGGDIIRAIAEK